MIRKIVERVDRLVTYVGLGATAVLMFLTSADALGRYLLNQPIEGAYQVTEDYLLIMCVFLTLGYSYREGAHVRVTFLVDRVKGPAKLVIGYFAQIFSVLCGLALTIATCLQAADNLRTGARASGLLNYPLWPAYFAVFVGCLMITLLMIIDLARVKDGTSALLSGGGESEQQTEIV